MANIFLNDSEIQERGLYEVKIQEISPGSISRTPPPPLEICAFGAVSIYPGSLPEL